MDFLYQQRFFLPHDILLFAAISFDTGLAVAKANSVSFRCHCSGAAFVRAALVKVLHPFDCATNSVIRLFVGYRVL